MLSSNYLIINKKAQRFSEMRVAGHTAVFLDEEGRPLDHGVLAFDDSVYTILSCSKVRLLMLVIEGRPDRKVEAVIWKDDDDFRTGAEVIEKASGMKISSQDLKINSYAWSISEKLDEGVRIRVADAVDTSGMLVCPECGMLNPKGSEYCLDCGAEL